jgi:hypothetical protein
MAPKAEEKDKKQKVAIRKRNKPLIWEDRDIRFDLEAA